MRISDKMSQTRHNLDEVYDSLGDGITSALNEMFEYGAEAQQTRIIKLLEQHLGYGDSEWDSSVMAVIALIKGEK